MTVPELIALALIIITAAVFALLVVAFLNLDPSTEWAEVLNTSITTLNGASP